MYSGIPKKEIRIWSWKQLVDCTTSELETVIGKKKPNENLIPDKV